MAPKLVSTRDGQLKSQESKQSSQPDRTASKHHEHSDKDDRSVSRIKRQRFSTSHSQKPHQIYSSSSSEDSDMSELSAAEKGRRTKRSSAPTPEEIPKPQEYTQAEDDLVQNERNRDGMHNVRHDSPIGESQESSRRKGHSPPLPSLLANTLLMQYIFGTSLGLEAILKRFSDLEIVSPREIGNITVVGPEDEAEIQTTAAEYEAIKEWMDRQEPSPASEDYDCEDDFLYSSDRGRYYTIRSSPKEKEENERIAQNEQEREIIRVRRAYIANEAFQELRDVELKIKDLKKKAATKKPSEQLRKVEQEFQAYRKQQEGKDHIREVDALLARANNLNVCIHVYMQDLLHAKEAREFIEIQPTIETNRMHSAYQGVRKARRMMAYLAKQAKEAAMKSNLELHQDMADYFFGLKNLMDGEFQKAEKKLSKIAQSKKSPEGKAAREILRMGVATYDAGRGFPHYRAFRDQKVPKRRDSVTARISPANSLTDVRPSLKKAATFAAPESALVMETDADEAHTRTQRWTSMPLRKNQLKVPRSTPEPSPAVESERHSRIAESSQRRSPGSRVDGRHQNVQNMVSSSEVSSEPTLGPVVFDQKGDGARSGDDQILGSS